MHLDDERLWGLITLLIWTKRWNMAAPREEIRMPSLLFELLGQVGSLQLLLALSSS